MHFITTIWLLGTNQYKSMTNMPIKAIEVPQWWKKAKEEEKKCLRKISEKMGVGFEAILKNRKEIEKIDDEEMKKLKEQQYTIETLIKIKSSSKSISKEIDREIELLTRIGKSMSDYSWAKFRLENIGNDFGNAENLYYDEERGIIKIRD